MSSPRLIIKNRFKITIIFIALAVVFSIGGSFVVASIFIGSSGLGSINLEKGLIGNWSFDGDAKDRTPNRNNGTVTGATLTTDRKSQSNKAYSLNGTTGYISLGDQDIFSFGNGTTDSSFTMAIWVNPTDATNFYTFVKRALLPSTNFEYGMGTNSSDKLWVRLYSATDGSIAIGRLYDTAVTAREGSWFFIVVTYDGSGSAAGLKIYLDGTRVDDTDNNISTGYTAMSNRSTALTVGVDGGGGTNFANGLIDDVRIYNRALSATEVTALYNSYNPGIAVSTLEKGLIGNWSFDGDAKDRTPNRNNGTVTGATLTTDRKGQSNKAYTFNGTTNYIDTADSNNFSPFVNDNMTISFWVYFNGVTSSNVIIGKAEASNYEWAIHPNSVTTWTSGGANHATLTSYASSATTGIWYHYTLVITDGDTTATSLAFYRDGISISATLTQTANSMSNTGSKVTIGRRGDNQDYFNGVVDDVRIYNRALSATEITALYNSYNPGIAVSTLEKGLIGNWSFDGDAKDRTPNRNNGTVSGATLTTDRKSQSNKAYAFDGTDDFINIGSPSVLNFGAGSTFSISAWFNVTNYTALRTIIAKMDDQTSSSPESRSAYALYVRTTGIVQGMISSTTTADTFERVDSGVVTTGVWNHAVFVVDSSQLRLYLNGVLVDSETRTIDPYTGGTTRISAGGSSSKFLGSIDDVRVYNRVLTAAEILALYNSY